MARFIPIDEPRRVLAAPAGFALWRLGFRPFYLLASAFASVAIAVWAAQFASLSVATWSARLIGLLGTPHLSGALWHAHEMLFGFALAVVVGFLFTAGRNWSNRPTPTGGLLVALAALWLAARVLVLTPFGWAATVVNTAFPLACAVALAVPLAQSRNRRNYFFVGLLLLMSAASLAIHLSQLGIAELPAWAGVQLALDVVLFIMAVMGGRVIPMFTNNGVPGAGALRVSALETLALGSVLVLLVADVAQLHGAALAGLLSICAVTHAVRWGLWKPWKTLRTPLVWVLHAAYLWIPLHLALRATSELGWAAASLATHALTVGAIGGLTIGMMTRTARGHTGRELRADRVDVACYALVLAAGVVRVFAPLVVPAWSMHSVIASAGLWSSGFALYAVRYWPWLSRPRVDGQPG